MSDYETEALELARQANEMPHGAKQVALWEQAIALADDHRDGDLGLDLRSDALWPMYHGNRADLLLVHYAWCLAYLDRTPDQDPSLTLWSYRLVIDKMGYFPDITRAQVDAAWGDMKTRYEAAGFSARSVWQNRRVHLCLLGDLPGAAEAEREFRRSAHGPLSDGRNVDQSFAVAYLALLGRDEDAARAAEPFLDGTITDGVFVHAVTNRVVLSLARLGRVAEGREMVAKSARVTRANPQYLGKADEPLTFLALTGDLAAAVSHFDRHFAHAVAIPGEFTRLSLYKHALFFARELVAANRALQLKVPEGLIPGVAGNRATPGELRDWLEVELPALCRRADARNGTAYYTTRLADLDDYALLARKLA